MGAGEKVRGYTCERCRQAFIAAEGRAPRDTDAERLAKDVVV